MSEPLKQSESVSAASACYASLLNRLRGIYTVPVNDGAGLLDGKDTFTQRFTGLPPINEEAAKAIEHLSGLVARLPRTADGVPFFIGDTVFIENEDRAYFGPEPVLERKVESLSKPPGFKEYRGEFNVSADDVEGGNLDFYSTKEACPNRYA